MIETPTGKRFYTDYEKGYQQGKADGRADAVDEFVTAYIKDEEQYDGCQCCERMDDYCCIQCFRDRFLQLKEQK